MKYQQKIIPPYMAEDRVVEFPEDVVITKPRSSRTPRQQETGLVIGILDQDDGHQEEVRV
jgi:hypothetical protein